MREEFHLYRPAGSKEWSVRKRRNGRSHSTRLETTDRRLARERAKKWHKELIASAWGEDAPRTFLDAANKFAIEHYLDIKPKTALRYKASLAHLLAAFGKLTLAQIGSAQLYEFEQKRRRDGVTAATIVNDFRCLSAIMNLAQVWEWHDRNPVQAYLKSRKKALKGAEPRSRYLSHEEETALYVSASLTWGRMISFAIETGLRREEMFSLLRGDINWQRNFIQVRKEVSKSASRQVPLSERAADTLRTVLMGHSSLFCFPKGDGTRYSPTSPTIMRTLGRICAGAGVEGLTWHDLRRTYGCRCLQDRRMSMEAVSKCMGHSSVKVTEQVYAFLKIDNLNQMLSETEGRVVRIGGVR